MTCCKTFAAAQKDGTDNEGYGPLIFPQEVEYAHGPEVTFPNGRRGRETGYRKTGWMAVGQTLPRIKFCPWCGATLVRKGGKA